MQTAYRCSDPDRVPNVLVLSDGLTEQRARAAMLRLIGERPRNTKVFCIRVGNDVNRPLLEQIANAAGGLASFVSRGDNFDRQARAFRRKLMHPVAIDRQRFPTCTTGNRFVFTDTRRFCRNHTSEK